MSSSTIMSVHRFLLHAMPSRLLSRNAGMAQHYLQGLIFQVLLDVELVFNAGTAQHLREPEDKSLLNRRLESEFWDTNRLSNLPWNRFLQA